MKILGFLVVTLTFTAAWSMPTIGDRVVYSIKQTSGQNSIKLLFEKKIVSANGGKYQVQETTKLPNGQQQVETVDVASDDLYSDENIEMILTNCKSLQGEVVMQSYPAGVFNTCKVSQATEQNVTTINFAKVPFGLAGVLVQDAQTKTEFMIQEYSWGSAE